MEEEDAYLDSISLVSRPKGKWAARHTHIAAMLGGHIFVGLLNQHVACEWALRMLDKLVM